MNPLARIGRALSFGKSNTSEVNEGAIAIEAELDMTLTPVLVWLAPNGQEVARVAVYFDTAANIGYASYQGLGTDAGDVGTGEIQGLNRANSKYGYIQVNSKGKAVINLRNGSDSVRSHQDLVVQGQSNDPANATTLLSLEAYVTPANAPALAGFGGRIQIYAEDGAGNLNYQGAVYGEWVGGTTDADLVLDAPHSIRFSQGTTPHLTGVRTGTLAQLQTVVANIAALGDAAGWWDDLTT